jgi:SPX domain protein involved in polyphosphate accumulation
MKFGQLLLSKQHPPWRDYYVDYKKAKKLLSAMTKTGQLMQLGDLPGAVLQSTAANVEKIDESFRSLLELYVARLNDFVKDMQVSLKKRRTELAGIPLLLQCAQVSVVDSCFCSRCEVRPQSGRQKSHHPRRT